MANFVNFRPIALASLIIACLLASLHPQATGSIVGVNYGRVGNNLPSPTDVVKLLKSNNIQKVKMFDTDGGVLRAFAGSGISLIVGLTNGELQGVASNQNTANQWVKNHIVPYVNSNVQIKYIAVGNEVFISNDQLSPYLYPAMENIYNALANSQLHERIKVSTPHATVVLDGNSYPPSRGNFQGRIKGQMGSILKFLSRTGSALMVNVYPFFAYTGNPGQINIQYATFGSAQGIDDPGTKLHYSNLFDAQLDTLIAAAAALGHPNIPVIVTETGWPSQGHWAATIGNARGYNGNLVKHVRSGTPRRPGALIETYIFSLFNENQKPGPEYERHFGLFYPDRSKVYDINLSHGPSEGAFEGLLLPNHTSAHDAQMLNDA